MLKKIILLVLFIASMNNGQNVANLLERINEKIKNDKTYLNLDAITFKPLAPKDIAGLQKIPLADGSVVGFRVVSNVSYQFIILPENLDFDEPVLLLVKEITRNKVTIKKVFGTQKINPNSERILLKFNDVYYIYKNYRNIYNKMLNKVTLLMENKRNIKKLLNIPIDTKIKKSRGISSPDNSDFLNYAYDNSMHLYPKESKISNKRAFLSRAVASSRTKIVVAADFSRVTFFYRKYMSMKNYKVSLDFNTEDPLLNILPYQTMVLNAGIRTFISLTGNNKKILSDFLISAKLMGRIRINTSRLAGKLPFISSNPPKLNLNPGVIFSANITRPFHLPFMNFYFVSGGKDYSNPFVKFGKPDSSYAYFTSSEMLYTMSFYWNTSQVKNVRLRFDVGIGRHNIIKAVYHNGTSYKLLRYKFQPYLKFYLVFAPQNTTFFSSGLSFYDSILKLNFWLQIYNKFPHNFRFGVTYISAPIFRNLRPWENDGSTMVGIIYRYGFK